MASAASTFNVDFGWVMLYCNVAKSFSMVYKSMVYSRCFSRQSFCYYFSISPFLKFSTPSADTCLTDFFPETISLTIAKIDDQSSKTVNGTFSLTQYDTRSVAQSAPFPRYLISDLPCPFFANKRSVSFAAERSETPSPA